MIVVVASFRLPAEAVDAARVPMLAAIAATRAEPGCRAYAIAEDVEDPGLFRVSEQWDSREALAAHFDTPHMREWNAVRGALGMTDRQVAIYAVDGAEEL